jgi:hypothetical protein
LTGARQPSHLPVQQLNQRPPIPPTSTPPNMKALENAAFRGRE